MLKDSWKHNSVLAGFSLLLHEVLTGATLGFVGTGIFLATLGKRPSKYIRNILALAVFISYWLKYGKLIDPEIGLNFLTSIIVLKILEKETIRDRYMIFFGLILLVSAGALFERTLTYVLFYGASFMILLVDFYSSLGKKWKLRELGISFLWVLPLTFFLFFFIPRMMGPIPFQQNTMAPGEIGYTPDVNISEIESLEPNQSPVFQVTVNKELSQRDLYWRGNTLSFNDGWNWKEMHQDREVSIIYPGKEFLTMKTVQNFRLLTRPEYFFALDYPQVIIHGDKRFGLAGKTRTLPQKRWEWVQKYQAISDPEDVILEKETLKKYLQVPLSKKEKEELKSLFVGNTVEEIGRSIRTHFLKSGFSYSLSPGKTEDLWDFLEKKTGFCSHYASATALIMRINGIPARLVSGFLGGNYNRFADFYLISQNDAHVWVEVLDKNKWLRLDPTEWIAPDRMRLGGEAFIESVNSSFLKKSGYFKFPPYFQEIKLWFQQWDFYFYQWLEEIDYYSQEAWFLKLKLRRTWLFSLVPLSIFAFMILYILLMTYRARVRPSSHEELWLTFYKRMEAKGIRLSRTSLLDSQKILEDSLKGDRQLEELWQDLVRFSFGQSTKSAAMLLKRIKSL